MALAHHDAALHDEGRGGEAEFVGPQQGADDHITAGTHAAVHLHGDAPPQAIEHQGLVGLGQADLPGRAGVLDGGERRGPGAAVVAGDGDVVGMGLGDAGRHRAHPHLGDQFDADARPGIDILQIVDELRQVLDGIDVVVGRR